MNKKYKILKMKKKSLKNIQNDSLILEQNKKRRLSFGSMKDELNLENIDFQIAQIRKCSIETALTSSDFDNHYLDTSLG